MGPLVVLIGTLALAADPPTPPPFDWDEATPAPTEPVAPPPAGPEAPPPARESPLGIALIGGEVLLPMRSGGRLLEQPLAVVLESKRRLGGPLEAGIRLHLGYAQLSRTERCGAPYVTCRPLLGVAVGGALRVTTPPGRALMAWLGLGAGIGGASNWLLGFPGVYGRADAGVELPVGRRRARLSAGWVEAAYTQDRPELQPGRQRYLAVTALLENG